MTIQIIQKSMTRQALAETAQETYKDMIKAVVDLDTGTLAVGGELHADAEAELLNQGLKQERLWGFNIYLNKGENDRLEFTSFINIRPKNGNTSIEISDTKIRQKIRDIVNQRIQWDS